MKILQIGAYPEFAVLEVPTPQPGPGEVLLRVEAVTTCPQWDLHLRHNAPMFVGHRFDYPYTPGQPGHEATGTIAAIGAGVTAVAVGDRVSAWRDPGHQRPGCYAQYAVLGAENVIRVPAHLPLEATASVELAMCVGATFLMLREMHVLAGRRIGIMGLGPAGLIAAQMARAEGAMEVIGFDPTPGRREFAGTLCVDAACDPRADLGPRFPARPAAPGLDSIIDCVGAKASVEFAMDHARDVVALFGVQREDYTFAPRHYGRLRLCGYPGHSREAAEYAVRLIERGALNLAPLVSRHLPLERYQEGIDLLESQQAIKVCFTPWDASSVEITEPEAQKE
jgi:threonine dehydrogenase-like Zn-dependent dehydrogenase